jgi:hypothetical protein
MITRKRTTIGFTERQCRALELIAEKKGIAKPTIPGMLAILISETPEFADVMSMGDVTTGEDQPNV